MNAPPPTADLGPQLGLTGPGAWAIAVLYTATFGLLAGFSGGAPMQTSLGWLALGLAIVAAVAVVLPGPYPMPRDLTAAVLGVVAAGTAAVVWQLPTSGDLGWSDWVFGASTYLLFMVTLRGRTLAATAGMSLIVGITLHWTVATTGDPIRAIVLTYPQVIAFAAVTFFALRLRRTARGIAAFRDAEHRREASEAAQAAAGEELRRQLDRVRREVAPHLERIAAGDVSPEHRAAHRLLEAELRDRIRGRSLATGRLPDALARARSRGVEIVVLDDLRDESPDPAFLAAALDWAIARVDALDRGEATVRLSRAGEHLELTFATGGDAETFAG